MPLTVEQVCDCHKQEKLEEGRWGATRCLSQAAAELAVGPASQPPEEDGEQGSGLRLLADSTESVSKEDLAPAASLGELSAFSN